MPTCHGLHGEDHLLWQLFGPERAEGYFVEVGARDGCAPSPTLSFERAGWRGLCVEARADAFELLRRNRKRSACAHAVVGSADEEPSPSGPSRARLSTLLAAAGAPPRVDVLAIAAGVDALAALEGLDLRRFAVRIVLLAEPSPAIAGLQRERMRALGYHDARTLGPIAFHCRYGTDVVRLREAEALRDVARVPHPLDAPARA